jgi:hypothetical protein
VCFLIDFLKKNEIDRIILPEEVFYSIQTNIIIFPCWSDFFASIIKEIHFLTQTSIAEIPGKNTEMVVLDDVFGAMSRWLQKLPCRRIKFAE